AGAGDEGLEGLGGGGAGARGEGLVEMAAQVDEEAALRGGEVVLLAVEQGLDGLEGQEALALQALDGREAAQVLLGVEGHVAARLAPRRQQALLEVEVDGLPVEARGLDEVTHPVAVLARGGGLGGGLHQLSSTAQEPRGWQTQA